VAGKILIVDDDPLICKVVAAVAKEAALAPSIANDLQKARELARIDRPDLVVCDIFLPDGPGTTLISYLRKLDDQVEVIMMTAGTRFELVVEAIREGAADFLEKPLSKEHLRSTLHRVLNRRAVRNAQRMEPQGRGTALLVEDDLVSLRVMANLLAEVGITSYLAQSIDEARQQLDTRLPDVIITDVFFQTGNGIDLLKEIKGKHPELPVIVVTSSNKPEIAIQILRAGAFDLALKPVDREDFQRAVLMARRFKLALDEQSHMERDLSNFRAGLEHLQTTMEQRVQERTADAIRAQEEAVRVLRSLPSGILVIDRDLRITEMNLAAEQLLGVPRPSVLQRGLEDFPPLDPFHKVALQVLHTGHSFNNLEMELTVNGARRAIGYGAGPMLGEVSGGGALVYFQDITAKKRLESYLRQSDRLVSLGMMAAGVTHEINNPLNVAMGYADLLERDHSDPERIRRHVGKIQSALNRAVEISNRLLRMVRAPSADLKPSDLHTSIKTVVGLLERKLQVSALDLDLSLDAQITEIEGDPVELEQLFLNLLVNACDATPGGGKLKVASTNHSGIVEVRVGDSGLGIAPDHLKQIFEPFYTTKEVGKGTGLGLSICQNIVERHGGTIGVESEPGKGTTFTIRLPLIGQKRRKRRAAAQAAAAAANKRVALIADPDGDATLCTIWLEEDGFEVTAYASLDEALKGMPSSRPAALLVDLTQCGSDGIEFMRTVHAGNLADRVVVLGGSPQATLLAAMDDAPPHKVLARPYSRDNLIDSVIAPEKQTAT
jgi:signal transduction histidine kinase